VLQVWTFRVFELYLNLNVPCYWQNRHNSISLDPVIRIWWKQVCIQPWSEIQVTNTHWHPKVPPSEPGQIFALMLPRVQPHLHKSLGSSAGAHVYMRTLQIPHRRRRYSYVFLCRGVGRGGAGIDIYIVIYILIYWRIWNSTSVHYIQKIINIKLTAVSNSKSFDINGFLQLVHSNVQRNCTPKCNATALKHATLARFRVQRCAFQRATLVHSIMNFCW
jgi:hypothetical protein